MSYSDYSQGRNAAMFEQQMQNIRARRAEAEAANNAYAWQRYAQQLEAQLEAERREKRWRGRWKLHESVALGCYIDAMRKLVGLIARELPQYKIPAFDVLRTEIRESIDKEMASKGIIVDRDREGTVRQLRVVDPSVDHYLK